MERRHSQRLEELNKKRKADVSGENTVRTPKRGRTGIQKKPEVTEEFFEDEEAEPVNPNSLPPEIMARIFKLLSNEDLLSKVERVNKRWKKIVHHYIWPDIEELSFENEKETGYLQCLIGRCKNLKGLHLGFYCDLNLLLSNDQNIRHLSIDDASKAGLEAVAKFLPNLRSLRVQVDDNNYRALSSIFSKCTRLEHVNLSFIGAHRSDYAVIAVPHSLKFRQMPETLKHLQIFYGDDNVPTEQMMLFFLSKCPKTLESVYLVSSAIYDDVFKPISQFTRLKCLVMEGYCGQLKSIEKFGKSLHGLQRFSLNHQQLSHIVKKCPHLEHLDFQFNSPPDGLCVLAELKELKSLVLSTGAVERNDQKKKLLDVLSKVASYGQLEHFYCSVSVPMKFILYLVKNCRLIKNIDCEIEDFSAKALSMALIEVHGDELPQRLDDPRIIKIRKSGTVQKQPDSQNLHWVHFVDYFSGKNHVLQRIQIDGLTEKPNREFLNRDLRDEY